MNVELLDHMGSDLTVANAARVSFDKHHEEFQDNDAKLIKFLATHNHFSPFCHAFAQFRVKAPIFVAAQLKKHQVGLAWNEVSRRYVDTEPEFYHPVWRERAENKKQGSADAIQDQEDLQNRYAIAMLYLENLYKKFVSLKVAPEQARMLLPQSAYTMWYWSGSLYAFARICNLRLKEDAQAETREIAKQIYDHLVPLFPVSMKELINIG
jgi:thymidylate synthase (FAD)